MPSSYAARRASHAPGVVAVGERELEYDELVVATGSSPVIPPIDGLDDVEYWTNRDAVWASDGAREPRRARRWTGRCRARAVLPPDGLRGHARRVQRPRARAARSDAGALLGERLEQDGIRVFVDAQAERVERGRRWACGSPRGGRRSKPSACWSRPGGRPNVEGLGLEQLGVEITERGVPSTTVCVRPTASGRSATSPVSGSSLTSASTRRAWRRRTSPVATCDADYRAIPAAVFTDPQVASVGDMEGDGSRHRRGTRSPAGASRHTSGRSGRGS